MKSIYNLCGILILTASNIVAQKKADFLIIQNPLQLTIFNKYEQPLDESSKIFFLSYSPFQILNKSTILGDQISKAVEFQFRNEVYYILKNEKGGLIGDTKDNYKQFFVGAAVIDDTITILQDNAVSLFEKYGLQGNRTFLQKKDMVIRIFKHSNAFYVLCSGKRNEYGWSTLEPKNAWEKAVEEEKSQDSISAETAVIFQLIIDRMQAVNKIYEQYFGYFNGKTKQQKSIPRWECRPSPEVLDCRLEGIFDPDQLSSSNQYLKQDIDNILIGKPYSVTYERGVIMVRYDGR